MTSPTPYQLLPRLTDDEYQALKADIAENGIRVPIDVDEDGTILDGHHRAWIAADLGVECPRRVVAGLTAEQKRTHAIAVNIHRRNLTREQRRELVARLRGDGMSTRRIAETVGVSQATAAREARESFDSPAMVTGSDGKQYPATRPTATVTRRESTAETVTVDTDTGEIVAPATIRPHRPRTDVVREINRALTDAETAASHADQIRPEHLTHRNDEAAVWGRRLAPALASLQRLHDALQEASQ